MLPRRIHRCRKVCEFHAKKPTGRTAVRFSKLPSTRQKTRSRASSAEAARPAGSMFEVCSFGLDGNIVSGLLPIANEGTKLARQFPPIKPGSVRGMRQSNRPTTGVRGDALNLPASGSVSLHARLFAIERFRFG